MARRTIAVLIPDAENDFALSVLRCLGEHADVRPIAVSADPWAPIRFSRYLREFVVAASDDDEQSRLDAIARASRAVGADVIIPVGQRAVKLFSAHADEAREFASLTPVPDRAAFDVAADKALFADFVIAHALPAPATIRCGAGEDFDAKLASLRFPVLLKPARGSYGRGIERYETADALRARLRRSPLTEQYVVQSYVEGFDIDCSVLCRDGHVIAYTVQKGFLPGYKPFASPAGVDFVDDAPTFDAARRLLEALRWSGVAHIDLRYDEDDGQVKLIEMNPRYWGSLLGSLAAGVNFPYLSCLAATGEPLPEIRQRPTRYVAGRAAVSLMTGGVFGGHRIDVGSRKSSISYAAGDPLPEIVTTMRSLIPGRG